MQEIKDLYISRFEFHDKNFVVHYRRIITMDIIMGFSGTVCEGKSTFVVPINNEDALLKALKKFFATASWQKLDKGLAGRAKIKTEFDRQIVVEVYVEAISYRSLKHAQ